jgi:hypothetical protein
MITARIFKATSIFLAISLISAISLAGTYSAGDGTPANPYQISTVADWQTLMATSADWDKHFVLTSDINLSGQTLTPVGSNAISFTGVFDGDGHVISNVTMNFPNNSVIGLFGDVDYGGGIKNLGVENVNMTGSYDVGGLIGELWDGSVSNCYTTGSVSGPETIGGLIGNNNGPVSGCYSSALVTCTDDGDYAGGLLGYNEGDAAAISDCYATGDVIGLGFAASIGGFIGESWDGSISRCFATGNVIGDYAVGGFAGYQYSAIINNCYATGSVTGVDDVGGLIGDNEDNTISNCFASGMVVGDSFVGGLIGDSFGDLAVVVTNCFWDMTTTGQSTSVGGIGKSTPNMKTKSTFTGWDFFSDGHDGIWRLCVDGTSYPRLLFEFAQKGDFACNDGTDFLDLAALAEHWLMTEVANPTTFRKSCDANSDGKTDLKDFATLSQNW